MHMKIRRTAKSEDTALILHTDFCFQQCFFTKANKTFCCFSVLGSQKELQKVILREYYSKSIGRKEVRWGMVSKAESKYSLGEFQSLIVMNRVNGPPGVLYHSTFQDLSDKGIEILWWHSCESCYFSKNLFFSLLPP